MTKSTGKRVVSKRGATLSERLALHSKMDGKCRVWIGSLGNGGYGKIKVEGKYLQAHRASWEMASGKSALGRIVCHKCDNRLCIRPSHLFVGTQQDNMSDMTAKGRQARGDRLPHSKFTPETVRAARAATGSVYEVAALFGVSPMTISRLRRGLIWSHVT